MDNIYLNIGCGRKKLPGFINIDIVPGADMQLDVRKGLPFDNNTVQGIFSEHFIEHMTLAESFSFLRECRRVLAPQGIVRLSTPDLDNIIHRYVHNNWRENNDAVKMGYGWLSNRCEFVNLAMHEWGHKYLYNAEELKRVASLTGFGVAQRCEWGKSENDSMFNGLEYRKGSTLIMEFCKIARHTSSRPLVSILIPAYKPDFFRPALESALHQTYPNIEIIVGDDNPGDELQKIVSEYVNPACNIRIVKNHRTMSGARENHLKIFGLAQGEYIKFLNDDDIIHENCVERMVECLNRYPDVTLVTSHRHLIDANGHVMPESFNRPVVKEDSIINGPSLVDAMLRNSFNPIGEPTTVMFRKQDLVDVKPDIFSIAGQSIFNNGDVLMWINLLSKGDAIYLTDTLSCFRIHEKQRSKEDDHLQNAPRSWQQIMHSAQRIGFLGKYSPKRINAYPLRKDHSDNGETSFQKCPGTKTVSIVIPVFNKADYTKRCLEALFKDTPDSLAEIIVVDNGSTDESADFLASIKDRIKIITNKENLGFAKACNQGARAASGHYLLFLNNDTEVQPGWIEPLVDILDSDEQIAAVGNKLLYPDNTIQHAGVLIVDDKPKGDPLLAVHIYRAQPADLPEADQPRTYQALTAACILIRRDSFKKAEGFDEGYWNGYEDVDLCFKLQEQGKKLVYQPASVVIHHESKSGPERFRAAAQNIKRLHDKWLKTIEPDLIVETDGSSHLTRAGKMSVYQPLSYLPEKQRLTSIIIPTCNQLDYTQSCLESVVANTPEPHEIILVDNGSTDGTRDFLESFSKSHDQVALISNDQNKGFAAAVNQGLARARGHYILWLKTDAVVGAHWLQRFIAHFEKYPHAGLVGSMSNLAQGPQKAGPTPGDHNLAAVQSYARNFAVLKGGKATETMTLADFCLFTRKDLIKVIGNLDENFTGPGLEADDLCLRFSIADYKNLIANDIFIHRRGNPKSDDRVNPFQTCPQPDDLQKFSAKWGDIVELKGDGYRINLTRERQKEKLIQWGEDRISKGDLKGAAKIFERVPRFLENDYKALNNLGVVQWQLGEAVSAIHTFQAALAINPKYPDALSNLMNSAKEAGKVDMIKPTLQKILKEVRPDNPDTASPIVAFQGTTP